MKRATWISAALLFAFALGCGKDSKSTSEIVQAWKKVGLSPGEFAKAETRLGGQCQKGTVSELEVTLCEFKDEQEAKQAQEKGYELVGETTGASLAKGRMLLVVADRKEVDPNGRRIKDLTNTFRQ